jgi:hypothetical protein
MPSEIQTNVDREGYLQVDRERAWKDELDVQNQSNLEPAYFGVALPAGKPVFAIFRQTNNLNLDQSKQLKYQ